MTIEQRLEVIKNRMGEQFDSQFKYKHSIESFCEQWEEYYKRNDRHKFLENECRKEYQWKEYESFYVDNIYFNKVSYEIYYCGMKNKKRFCSINGKAFELNSDFEKNAEEHFQIPNIGYVFWSNLYCWILRECKVRSVHKIFQKLP